MAQVKNVTNSPVSIVTDSLRNSRVKVTRTILPGQVMDIPLSPGLKRLVEEGYVQLVKGGEILDIPGGLRHKLPEPLPPLRSVDDDWSA